MPLKSIKNGFFYLMILAAGLIVGHYLPQYVQRLMPKYSEGDFSTYYLGTRADVIVYGTASCPYCIKARDYFKQRHIAFADVDVAGSEKGKQDFAKLKGKGVPLILIGKRKMTGFNQSVIDDALTHITHPVNLQPSRSSTTERM